MSFNTIPEGIESIRQGEILVVVDDPDRENEGDLVMAAEKATPEAINFMAKYGRGMICLPATSQRLKELELFEMVSDNTSKMSTAFTVTIDAKEVKTGISAQERSMTIQQFINPKASADDFLRPGHIFPLKATEGGVLRRAGHTEAAIDLCKLADLQPAGVICEILSEDGTMARAPELMTFAKQHKLKIITIEVLIAYRLKTETLIRRTTEATLPTMHGQFQLISYESITDGETHVPVVIS